jgi:hypothetical protein
MQPTNFSPNAASSPRCVSSARSHLHTCSLILIYCHQPESGFCDEARNRTHRACSIVQNATAAQSRIAFSAVSLGSGQKASRGAHMTTFQHLFNPGAHAGILYYLSREVAIRFPVLSRRALSVCVCVMSDCVGRALRRTTANSWLDI